MKTSSYNRTVLLMLGAGILALGVMDGGTVAKAVDSNESPNLKGMTALVPLEQIIDKAEAKHVGRLLEAEVKLVNGQDVYEIEILDESGKVWEMYFDAKTGELLRHGEEQDSEDISR